MTAHLFSLALSSSTRHDERAAEARKIMSAEHKALGFRPPHGSLAAEAQAAAARHPLGLRSPEQGQGQGQGLGLSVPQVSQSALYRWLYAL